MLDVEVDADAAAFVVARPAFTVADHRAELALTPAEGREQLQKLLDSGLVVRQPGTRGLRFTART